MKDDSSSALRELINRGEFSFSKGLGRKTESLVFDRGTLRALFEIMNRLSIRYIDYPVSSGKESVVFKAQAGGGPVAVKIYKRSTIKFNKLHEYIDGDHRFDSVNRSRSGIILLWARKEFTNLLESRRAGVLVPEPIAINKNVLVMKYLGTVKRPAPQLRKVDDPETYYSRILTNVRLLVERAGLVHADLSEFNILIHRKKPYLIDMAQSVSITHPKALQFLRRDLNNISSFYARSGIVTNVEALLSELGRSIE